jgi:hypothetical protein
LCCIDFGHLLTWEEALAKDVANAMQETFLRVWAADMLADTWAPGQKRAYLRLYERGLPKLT